MAGNKWTYNTGTSTRTGTWTSTGTTVTTVRSKDLFYSGAQLSFKKAATIRETKIKKGFWDDVEWEDYSSYIPRKSITGKWIIGKMHKRWRTPESRYRGKGLGSFKQFAKTKELFEEKLKGKA